MVTTTLSRPTTPVDGDTPAGFRLRPRSYHRRPWQLAGGAFFILICGGIGAVLFQTSSNRISVVIAAQNLPAGTILTPADLGTGSLPANDNISAMSSSGASVLIGQQLAVPVAAGQLMVKSMISSGQTLPTGSQVVGLTLKGNQMPSVPIVDGDIVQVISVPQPGQAPAGATTVGTSLVATATVLAVGPAAPNQTQYLATLSIEVPAAAAPSVAGYAAADEIAITLVGGPAQ